MIDRVLMLTRKMMLQLDDLQGTVKEVYNELAPNETYAYEVKQLDDVIHGLKEFHTELDNLEHVVLAEGIR